MCVGGGGSLYCVTMCVCVCVCVFWFVNVVLRYVKDGVAVTRDVTGQTFGSTLLFYLDHFHIFHTDRKHRGLTNRSTDTPKARPLCGWVTPK